MTGVVNGGSAVCNTSTAGAPVGELLAKTTARPTVESFDTPLHEIPGVLLISTNPWDSNWWLKVCSRLCASVSELFGKTCMFSSMVAWLLFPTKLALPTYASAPFNVVC